MFALLSPFSLVVPEAHAESTSTFPAADSATICEGECHLEGDLLSLTDQAEVEQRGLIGFNVVGNGIPAGATVKEAVVTIAVAQGDASKLAVACLAETWTQTWATWWRRDKDLYWSSGGAEGASRVGTEGTVVSAGALATFDATECVQRWLKGEPEAGFILDLDTNDSGEFVYIYGHSAQAALAPVLSVVWSEGESGDTGSGDPPDTGGSSNDSGGGYDTAGLPRSTDSDGDRFSLGDGDCADNDPDIYPGRDETCDGIDNNCDGDKDEGCPLPPAGEGCDCGGGSGGLLGFGLLGASAIRRRASSAVRRSGTSPS
jgi:uncharacterized protein (TIGR03382 family)